MLVAAFLVVYYYPDSYVFYYLLTCFCGMQSAMGAKMKDTVIRTAAFTGCVVDIGATVGRLFRQGESAKKSCFRTLKLLGSSLSVYMFGAFLATLIYPYLGIFTILVNVVGFFIIAMLHTYYSQVPVDFYEQHVLTKE